MSEADANRDLLAAAERPDPLEITQTMTFSERRARAREACVMWVEGALQDAVTKTLNSTGVKIYYDR